MARKTRTARTAPNATTDTFVAPRKPRTKHTPFAEAVAAQAAEDDTTEEAVLDALAAPEEEAKPTRPVGTSNLANTIRAHRKNYAVALHPNGKKTQNNGDPIAQLLLLVSLDELKDFSAIRFEGKRYDHLNPGHARMCIGNNIRGAARKGCPIVRDWSEAVLARLQQEENAA